MSTPLETVQEFVAAFRAAWTEGDVGRIRYFFSEDAVYHNGPMEPIRGCEAILSALAGFMDMGGEVDVDVAHIIADDSTVLTERVDYFTTAGKTISLPVMGIFEVDGEKIIAWRDYFDLEQFVSQLTI